MTDVFLALGSNIDAEKMLPKAYQALLSSFANLQMSPVYHNKAVGFEGPDFYNCVSYFTSDKSLAETSKIIQDIQVSIDSRWGEHAFNSRAIDLDLLIYGDTVTDELEQQIPRDDITEYAFVLKPLVDIAPDYQHPELQKSFQQLWNAYPQSQHLLTEVDINWQLGSHL